MLGVATITLIVGGSVPLGSLQIGSVGMLWQFAPALLGLPLGLIAYRFKILQSSGKWIWVPGLILALRDGFYRGMASMPERLWVHVSGENPIMGAIDVLTLSCALYSLTLSVRFLWERHRLG